MTDEVERNMKWYEIERLEKILKKTLLVQIVLRLFLRANLYVDFIVNVTKVSILQVKDT